MFIFICGIIVGVILTIALAVVHGLASGDFQRKWRAITDERRRVIKSPEPVTYAHDADTGEPLPIQSEDGTWYH